MKTNLTNIVNSNNRKEIDWKKGGELSQLFFVSEKKLSDIIAEATTSSFSSSLTSQVSEAVVTIGFLLWKNEPDHI